MKKKSFFMVLTCAFMLLIAVPGFSQEISTENQDTPENIAAPDQTAPAPEEPEAPAVEEEIPGQDQEAQPAESEDDQSQKGKTPKKSTSKEPSVNAMTSGGGSGGQKNGFSAPPVPDAYVYTGAAGYSIPIEVPPGRNGLAPNLKLIYNSYRGNSWVGLGWGLDLGSIRRSTKHGLSYSADNFVFEGAGASEELVSGTTTWGANYYRAKIEGEFSKYYYNTGTSGWEVTAKDGTRYYYGSTVDSRQTNANGIFRWCLDRIEDTNANYLTVTYTKDQGEIYLDRIDYTGHAGLAPSNYVKFYLEDRPDKPYMYDSNAKVVTGKRLKTVEIRNNSSLVRVYGLEYIISGSTSRSVLHRVQEYGSDAQLSGIGAVTSGTTLPGIEMGTQNGGNGAFSFANSLPGFSFANHCYMNATYGREIVGDFNGDGKTDFAWIYPNPDPSYSWVAMSNGDGTFNFQNSFPGFSFANHCYMNASYGREIVGDFNGDGKTDFAWIYPNADPNYSWVAISNGDGTFTFSNSLPGASFATHSYMDTTSYGRSVVGDFNGDGKTDFAWIYPNSDPNYSWVAISNGDGTFAFSNSLPGASFATHSYMNTSYGQAVVGDFNGDGKTDFSWIYPNPDPSYSWVALSNGDGTFNFQNSFPSFSFANHCYMNASYGQAVVGDFNGDGKTDFAWIYPNPDPSYSWVALSNGDGTFNFQNSFPSFSFANHCYMNASHGQAVVGDFNGDGKTDFSWIYPNPDPIYSWVALSNGDGTFNFQNSLPGFSSANHCYMNATYGRPIIGDLNGDGKTDFAWIYPNPDPIYSWVASANGLSPDLLTTITNSLGGSASIGYTPSSAYQNTNLPFIINMVSGVTVNDGLGNQTVTTYTYQGGLYNFPEREFRGFAKAKKTNPDLTTEETWFKQDKYFQGRAYQSEFREAAGGSLLSGTSLTWTKTDYSGNDFSFVKLSQKKSIQYENGAETAFTQENYTYDDSNGNLLTTLIQGTDAENLTITNLYQNYGSWVWRTTQETFTGSTSGKVRENYYLYENNTGNLSSKSSWLQGGTNPTVGMTYDDYGNVRYVTDAMANITETQYDSTNTYPIKVIAPATNGVTHITETGWNYLFGSPSWTKDENLNTSTYQYDLFGRTKQIDYPDGGQMVYQYYDNEFPRKLVTRVKEDAAGHFIDKYQYFDGLGRLIQTNTLGEDNQPIAGRIRYDKMGRVDLTKGPFFAAALTFPQQPTGPCPWTSTAYDFRGRPIQIENPHGDYPENVFTSFEYSGLMTTVIDPDNARKKEKKDYLGRIIEVKEYENTNEYHTTYQYNAAGDLLKVTNTYGKEINLTYDTLGRKKEMSDPDMGYWTYTYDPNNNLLTQTDAKNQVISFIYDALNRVLTKSNGTVYAYDNLTANANGRGRVYSVTKGNVVNTNNGYDKMGRVTSATKTIDANNYTTQTVYDLSGKVTQITYPDSHIVVTSYYPGTGLVQAVSSGTTTYGLFTDYQPNGKIGQVTHANGIATYYNYDASSTRIFGIVTEVPGENPADALQDKSYHYTRAGDIDQIIDHKKNITYNYTYDPLHRLITETGGPEAISYTYNAVGSILTRTIGTKTFNYNYNNAAHVHAVSSITYNGNNYAFNYDANANLTSGPDLSNLDQVATRTVTYDVDNMPTQIVRGSTTVSFTYDGTGARIKKAVSGGSTTLYIGAHYEVKDSVITKYIFGGNLRLAVIKGSLTYYYHKDHLGSTGAITDSTGAKVESAEYQPFGTMREHTGSNVSDYKFTDQELDNETNLYNYDARLYDAIIGIFATPDPFQSPNLGFTGNNLILAGRISHIFYEPQLLNRYSYCINNPLIYTDPTGRFPGQIFGSPEEAAHDFGMNYNDDSIRNNVEYGSTIYGIEDEGTGEKGYSYSTPNKGTDEEVTCSDAPTSSTNPEQEITDLDVGTVHSHGAYVSGFKNNVPSDADLDTDTNTADYVTTPNGSLIAYDRTSDPTSPNVVKTDLPSDPNDPDRQNTVDPYQNPHNNLAHDSDGTVICTELFRQGIMPLEIYTADKKFGNYIAKNSPHVMRGYHFIAKPIVNLMRKSRCFTHFINLFAKPWSMEMAHRVGASKKSNLLGLLIMEVGAVLCNITGIILSQQKLIFGFFIILILFIIFKKMTDLSSIFRFNLLRISLPLILFLTLIGSSKSYATKDSWDSDKDNWTELMKAVYLADFEKIIKLVELSNDINDKTKSGLTALEISIRIKNIAITKYLVEHGCDISNLQYNHYTPLMIASEVDNIDAIKLFINKGANINLRNNSGWTAFMSATTQGSIQSMELLLNNGADINFKRSIDGTTALMLAVYNQNIEKVYFLLKRGAVKDIRDNSNNSAYDINETLIKAAKNKSEIIKRKKLRQVLSGKAGNRKGVTGKVSGLEY